jgi:hypothetical protein
MPTTNNNWPTPVATDLVKDGWEAIKDLGDAIDTTLGVYSPATPMGVHLSTVTFSGVASQSLNDVFSATYDNYAILLKADAASGSPDITFRLRVGGVDASGATDYVRPVLLNAQNSATVSNIGGAASSSGYFGLGSADEFVINSIFFNPFLTKPTFNTSQNYGANYITWGGNRHTLSTSYTGITILTTSNITGEVSVYGFSK